MAEPCGYSRRGSEPIAVVISGVNTNARPSDITTWPTAISHACSGTRDMIPMPTTTAARPGTSSGRGPTRSNSRPTNGASRPIARPPGSIISPTDSVDSSSTRCRKIGSSTTTPNIEPIITTISPTATAKLRLAKVRRSSSARSWRCSRSWRSTNSASAATPTASATSAATGGPDGASAAPPWPPPLIPVSP